MDPALDALTAHLWEDYHAGVARFRAANPDLRERFRAEGGAAYYDPADDLLILVVGAVRPCAVLELSDVLWVRIDPATDRFLGFEVPSVTAFAAAHPEAAPPLEAAVAALRATPCVFVPCATQECERLADALEAVALVEAGR